MDDQPRCVWLTREQRDKLDAIYASLPDYPRLDWEGDTLVGVVSAWDAAPADPAEAAAEVLRYEVIMTRPDSVRGAKAVLRALGEPT